MSETHFQCGRPLTPEDPHDSIRRDDLEKDDPKRLVDESAPEFDHRGVQLPARSRVGGIITPQ